MSPSIRCRSRAAVTGIVVVVAIATLVAACSGDTGPVDAGLTKIAPSAGTQAPAETRPPDSAAPHTLVLETTSTVPVWAPTTTTQMAVPAVAAPGVCLADPPTTSTSTTTIPGRSTQQSDVVAARAALDRALNDPRFQQSNLAVSIWLDGPGEIAARNADTVFPPASNQKLFTAVGVFERLDIDEKTRTTVIASGPTVDGVLQGDLVVVGGGDPTVTKSGVRSLDALATQLHARGIIRVTGKILVDESRYDTERSVPSWPSGWESTIGPLSALVVDRNKNVDLIEPALAHGQSFAKSLNAVGITVDGTVELGVAPEGVQVAVLEGPTYGDLVEAMLKNSDNLAAELLVKEIGRRHTGNGSTADGLASIRDAVAVLCVPPGGADVDGSGFSAADSHATSQVRRLLQLAARRPWGPRFKGSLAVAGQSGTLAGRLLGPLTTGNVRAKTGSIAVSKALSGYVTTASGRQAYFSVIVNGPLTGGLDPAIDNIVAAVAGLRD